MPSRLSPLGTGSNLNPNNLVMWCYWCCRSAAGGGAAGIGCHAEQAEAVPADAVQEDVRDGAQSGPGSP